MGKGMTGAERQAAWRERRQSERVRLEKEVERLRKGQAQTQPKDAEPVPDLDKIPTFGAIDRFEKKQATTLERLHVLHWIRMGELRRTHEAEIAKLKAAIPKGGGKALRNAPIQPTVKAAFRQNTLQVWQRKLRPFVHPDKYHGTDLEKQANEVTAWINSWTVPTKKPKR
jgi:hypothetical protein